MRIDWASSAARLRELALKAGEVAVITHRNADLDALASGLIVSRILSHLGVEHCLEAPEGPSRQAREALKEFSLEPPPPCGDKRYGLAITVDSTNSKQLGSALRIYLSAASRAVIDHHEPGGLIESADLAVVDPSAASTSEITVMLASELRAPMEPGLASIALLGIVADSRRFTMVGDYTFEAAQRLIESGADYGRVMEFMRKSGQQAQEDLSLRIAKLKAFSRLKLGRACNDILVAVTHIGSHEASVARSLVAEGADVAVVVVERKEGYRVSIRVSQRAVASGVTASKIAAFIVDKFGGEGGGHDMAGMAHVPPAVSVTAEDLANAIAERLPGKVGRICVEYRAGAQK